MDKTTVLKTSAIGGFEKKAVLDYIYKLNEEAEYAQAQLQEQLDEANKRGLETEASLKELTEICERQKKELEAKNAEIAGERERTEKLTALSESQEDEISRYRELIDVKQREAEKYTRENLRLMENNSKLETTRDEVERAYSQIGKLMLDARRDAQTITAKAEEEAAQVVAKATAEAAAITGNADSEAQMVIEKAEQEISAASQTAQLKAGAIVTEARTALDLTLEQFEQFRRQIEQAQQKAEQAIDEMQEKAKVDGEIIKTVMEQSAKKLEEAYEPVVELAPAAPPAIQQPVAGEEPEPVAEEEQLHTPEPAQPEPEIAGAEPAEHYFFR